MHEGTKTDGVRQLTDQQLTVELKGQVDAEYDCRARAFLQGAKRVVDRSLAVIGGRSLRRGSLIERLYRDVAAGVLHNPSPDTVLRALGSPDLTGRETFAR